MHKELKGERDISLIKILDFPVAMRFIVYRYKDSFKMMFLTSQGDNIVLNGFWNQLRFCSSTLLRRSVLKLMLLLHIHAGSPACICLQCYKLRRLFISIIVIHQTQL